MQWCKKNKEIKIVALDGIPKTSYSNRCNRMQPPKIKIFRHRFCLHFNHCSFQCPLHCDPSLLTSAWGMKGGYDSHASAKVIRKPWRCRWQEYSRHWIYNLLLNYVTPNSNVKPSQKPTIASILVNAVGNICWEEHKIIATFIATTWTNLLLLD
jgi:hypothetical protein